MQAIKRCGRCNTENAPDQIYCTKCGKFLSARVADTSKNITIWNMDDDTFKDDVKRSSLVQRDRSSDASQRYVVICPQCNSASEVIKGMMPLACKQCGYFFQAGIDRAVPESSLNRRVSDLDHIQKTTPQPPAPLATVTDNKPQQASPGKKNPLASTRKDTSSMRLIVITQKGMVPEDVNEKGDVVGVNGTILKMINTQQQISIWHSPAGWYARTLSGQPLFNGVPVNVGMQIKLNDGDILTIEREQVRVEII